MLRAMAAGSERPSAGESVGDVLGPYRLLERIGEGGFGSVYLAEQSQPVQRRVALKVIKLGMDTRQVVARFNAERQVLAMMNHPGIARVFDAGATERGRLGRWRRKPGSTSSHSPPLPMWRARTSG